MAGEEREITLTIRGKNLSDAAFESARKQLAGVKKATDDSKPSADGFSLSLGSLTKAAGLLGVGLSVGAVVNFGKSIINMGGEISDTSKRFGVSSETIQRWKYALEQSGGSLTGLEKNLVILNKVIDEGGTGTRAILQRLGLDLDNLRLMDRATMMETVTDAIGQATDPVLQLRAATILLGKTGVDNLPTYIAGLAEIGAQSDVMSDETVESLDRAGDAWASLGTTIKVSTGTVIATAIDMWSALTQAYQRQGEEQLKLLKGTKAFGMVQTDATVQTRDVTSAIMAAWAPMQRLTDSQRFSAAATEFSTSATAKLSVAQRDDIQAMLKRGATQADILKSLEAAGVETDLYKGAITQLVEQHKADKKATDDKREALARIQETLSPLTATERARIQIAIDWFTVNGKLIASEKDIALAYGFSEEKIKLVIAANTARAETEQTQAAILKALSKELQKDKADEAKAAEAMATASAKSLTDLVVANKALNEELALAFMSTADKHIFEIGRARGAEILALGIRTEANKGWYDANILLINARYQHELDLANGTADTITERMELMGIDTAASLRATAEAAGRDFDQMLQSGEFTADKLVDKWKEYNTQAAAASTGVAKVFYLAAANIDQYGVDLIRGLIGGWDSFKSASMRILDDILGQFINVFVKGLIGSALGVKNAWGAAFSAIGSGAGAASAAASSAAVASEAASVSAASSALGALGSIAAALGPVAAIIAGVYAFTGGPTQLGREIPLETSPEMTPEAIQEFIDSGGNLDDVFQNLTPEAIQEFIDSGGNLDDVFQNQFASGGIAEGRQVAILAEGGRREIVGSEEFMVDAIKGAFDRMGVGSGGYGPTGNAVGPVSSAPVCVYVSISDKQLEPVIVRTGQRALDSGRWQPHTDSIRSRVGS